MHYPFDRLVSSIICCPTVAIFYSTRTRQSTCSRKSHTDLLSAPRAQCERPVYHAHAPAHPCELCDTVHVLAFYHAVEHRHQFACATRVAPFTSGEQVSARLRAYNRPWINASRKRHVNYAHMSPSGCAQLDRKRGPQNNGHIDVKHRSHRLRFN